MGLVGEDVGKRVGEDDGVVGFSVVPMVVGGEGEFVGSRVVG